MPAYSNNYGLNDVYEYLEYELDSLDSGSAGSTQSGGTQGAAPTDWASFTMGGKSPLTNIAAFKVLEVEFPVSWYLINTKNQNFILAENGGSTTGPPNVTLPVGNYNTTQLCTALGTALTAASVTSGILATYTVTYNSQTGTITVTGAGGTLSSYSFTFGLPTNSGNTNPRLWIGFPGGTTSSSGLTLTSPNVINLSGPNYVYLNSKKLGTSADLYLPQGAFNLGGGNSGPQVAKIPINQNSNGVVFWQDPDPQKWFNTGNLPLLDQVDFYFTLGNTTSQIPLQFNGLNFSVKLGLLKKVGDQQEFPAGGAQNERVVARTKRARY